MSRRIVALVAAIAMTDCASHPPSESHAAPWSECAKTQATFLLDQRAQATWPTVATLPEGEPMQMVDLGPDPPVTVADAFIHTLYLAPDTNSVYIVRSGGIAGRRKIYGPISLEGHCQPASPSAP
jgi:hypothetical protein